MAVRLSRSLLYLSAFTAYLTTLAFDLLTTPVPDTW